MRANGCAPIFGSRRRRAPPSTGLPCRPCNAGAATARLALRGPTCWTTRQPLPSGVRRALAAVEPELCGVLIDVCCHLKGLEEAERLAGWPQRSAKIVLQLALTSLARHYGIEPAAPADGKASFLRHWGSERFSPRVRGAGGRRSSGRQRLARLLLWRRSGCGPPSKRGRWTAARSSAPSIPAL